jgi:hypothetical protein
LKERNIVSDVYINGEVYFSAKKAMGILCLSYAGLRYQTKVRKIRRGIPEGRRQWFYHGQDVYDHNRAF